MANLPSVLSTIGPLSETDWRVQRLRGWDQLNQSLPDLGPEKIRQALADIDAALAPIDPPILAAALQHTLVLWRTPEGGANVAAFYLEALEEFPPDVVAKALKHVRMTHRYPSAPLPADFRAAALDAAVPLRAARVRAKLALNRIEGAAHREKRWAERQPVKVGDGTYSDVRGSWRDPSDGKSEIDLGNTAERIAGWESAA